MTKEKIEPVIPQLVKNWKNREVLKKQKEIDMLNLEIEKAKLQKKLKEVKNNV